MRRGSPQSRANIIHWKGNVHDRPFDHKRRRRIAHLAEGLLSPRHAKTTCGVMRYGHHESVAVIDSTNAGRTAGELLGGLGAGVPVVASLKDALALGPDTLLVGIAPTGGVLPLAWRETIARALAAGLDVISGLHEFLADLPELAAAAREGNATIWDVRRPGRDLPVGGGLCRWAKSHITLMVGTDCSIGKMTVALEIERDARSRGLKAEFVATGQTGIMIAGWGSPIDAIPGDFMAGCVERDVLSVDGADMILVEGQGSLLHPGYSSVSLALLHGSCPDALILCHDVSRNEVSKIRSVPFPPLLRVAEDCIRILEPLKRAELVGVALNTSSLDEAQARAACEQASRECGVPATDPVRFGAGVLTRAIIESDAKRGR